MKHLCLASAIVLASLTAASAQIASDNASNYGGTWGNGTNGGSGFLPWSITNNNGGGNFAGSFTGNSTAGAGNINTSGVSFGLFANPAAAAINATRAFSVSLASGNIFTFQLALNFDNGNKGFDFFAGSQGTVFNFNVGGGASVSSANATLNPGSGQAYDYGGNNAVFNVTLSMTSSTQFSYNISRTSSQGNQGTLFSGNVTALTQAPSGFGFYVAGTTAGGAQNDLYANSLSVVPEPSTYALLAIGLVGMIWLRGPRRNPNA